jgi:hypothetical protein
MKTPMSTCSCSSTIPIGGARTGETFVLADQFDGELAAAAQKTQPDRERADDEAWPASEAVASATIELADRCIAAVETRFA